MVSGVSIQFGLLRRCTVSYHGQVLGSEAGARCTEPAGSAGQAMRATAEPLILCTRRELLGCQVAQARVRMLAGLFDSPLLDLAPRRARFMPALPFRQTLTHPWVTCRG